MLQVWVSLSLKASVDCSPKDSFDGNVEEKAMKRRPLIGHPCLTLQLAGISFVSPLIVITLLVLLLVMLLITARKSSLAPIRRGGAAEMSSVGMEPKAFVMSSEAM